MSQPLEYRNTKALSQSSLKLIEYNPKKFYRDEYLWIIGQIPDKPEDKPTDAMILGTIVDVKLTTPEDLDQFVVLNNVPSGQMKEFVDTYFEIEHRNLREKSLTVGSVDLIGHAAYDKVGFKRDSYPKVIERFKVEGAPYYTALVKSVGKTPVSQELMGDALGVYNDLIYDEFTGPILKQTSTGFVEVFNQLDVYFNLKGIPLKALLDKVIVDHTQKTIEPYDIKTCGDSFLSSFGNYRYDLQGAFYLLAVRIWRDTVLKKNEYKILPFKFIVGFTNHKGLRPEIWEMTEADVTAGSIGGTTRSGRTVRGYLSLLRDYQWHMDYDRWDYPAEVYRNNGIKLLNYYD